MLIVDSLSLAYGGSTVVKAATFSLEVGEIGCLLGPSGCGKSTLLRGIAGFEHPVGGAVSMDGVILSEPSLLVEPENRNIGMAFQDFALFPHLNVERNITYGLNKLSKTIQRQRVDELLNLFGLPGYNNRMPHSLSGGEQQRIALARAIAPKPKLLLMDEAFSNLDVELRLSIVPEVRDILKQESISAILVTHDQREAFAMADWLGVMEDGRILQWADPRLLYHRPATRFVAQFVGEGELIEAIATSDTKLKSSLGTHDVHQNHNIDVGNSVEILIRPDDIYFDEVNMSELVGEIVQISFHGSHHQYRVQLKSDQQVFCLAASYHRHEVGERIGLVPKLETLVVFNDDGSSTVYDSTLDTFLKSLAFNPFV